MIPIYQRVAPNEHAIGKPVTQWFPDGNQPYLITE
jgi:hypothetical protein